MSENPTANHRQKISSLNGLRTISITLVLLAHFSEHVHYNGTVAKYLSYVIFNGALGVNFFFIISGFLITMLLIDEESRTGNISLRKFYVRRVIRIFPAYYLLLLVYFLLQLLGYIYIPTSTWIGSLTFTRQFFTGSNRLTLHLWSLSVEEVFYLVWPLLFISNKIGRTYKTLFLICAFVVLKMLLYRYPSFEWSLSIFTRADALLIGCLFAINYNAIVSYIFKNKMMLIWLILAIFIFIYSRKYVFHLAGEASLSLYFKIILSLTYAFIGDVGLLTNIAIALIIVYSINIKNLWFKFLNLKVMDFIGKLSYSIYLWQNLFTGDSLFLASFSPLIRLFFIFITAIASYYLLERPFLRLKSKFN